MLNHIALITILTDDVPYLVAFYRDALGFTVKQDMGSYVEFDSDGVRFAVCARSILHEASDDASYTEARRGHGAVNTRCAAAKNFPSRESSNALRNPTAASAWGQHSFRASTIFPARPS